jgi:hypothetical protein
MPRQPKPLAPRSLLEELLIRQTKLIKQHHDQLRNCNS